MHILSYTVTREERAPQEGGAPDPELAHHGRLPGGGTSKLPPQGLLELRKGGLFMWEEPMQRPRKGRKQQVTKISFRMAKNGSVHGQNRAEMFLKNHGIQ